MNDEHHQMPNEFLSPQEMQDWLRQELKDLAKSVELRTTQAASFVIEYAMGKLTAEEADNHLQDYRNHWPEPLPGSNVGVEMTDSEIMQRIEISQDFTPHHTARERYRRLFRSDQKGPKTT